MYARTVASFSSSNLWLEFEHKWVIEGIVIKLKFTRALHLVIRLDAIDASRKAHAAGTCLLRWTAQVGGRISDQITIPFWIADNTRSPINQPLTIWNPSGLACTPKQCNAFRVAHAATMDSTAGGRRKGTGLRDQIRRNRRTPDTEVMRESALLNAALKQSTDDSVISWDTWKRINVDLIDSRLRVKSAPELLYQIGIVWSRFLFLEPSWNGTLPAYLKGSFMAS